MIRKPCWWLIQHPFQLSSGILGVAVACIAFKTKGMIIISAFVLGGSLAHLFDSNLHNYDQKIMFLLYPTVGVLAGGSLLLARVDPSLSLMAALALACSCYQQVTHSKN